MWLYFLIICIFALIECPLEVQSRSMSVMPVLCERFPDAPMCSGNKAQQQPQQDTGNTKQPSGKGKPQKSKQGNPPPNNNNGGGGGGGGSPPKQSQAPPLSGPQVPAMANPSQMMAGAGAPASSGLGVGSGVSAPYFQGMRGVNVDPLRGVQSGSNYNIAGIPISSGSAVNFGGLPGLSSLGGGIPGMGGGGIPGIGGGGIPGMGGGGLPGMGGLGVGSGFGMPGLGVSNGFGLGR